MKSKDLFKEKVELGGPVCISIGLSKGGVSKSTTSSDLAYVLSTRGYRCLVIDADNQSSLSFLLGCYPNVFRMKDYLNNEVKGLQNILDYAIQCLNSRVDIEYEEIAKYIIEPTFTEQKRVKNKNGEYVIKDVKTPYGFYAIPCDVSLANYEQILSTFTVGKKRVGGMVLYQIIDAIKKSELWDFIILDLPPALSTISYNCYYASVDGVISPVNMNILTLRSLANTIEAVKEIQGMAKENNIKHSGILSLLRTKYTRGLTVQQSMDEVIKEFSPIKAFNTIIPSKTACEKAQSMMRLFAQEDREAYKCYSNLVDEIIEKILENRKN